MPEAKRISIRTKGILMNVSAAFALLYRYWKGTSLFIVAGCAIFAFVSINVLLMFAARKESPSRG